MEYFCVYGHEFSLGFLEELKNLSVNSVLAYIIRGDFNLVGPTEDISSGDRLSTAILSNKT